MTYIPPITRLPIKARVLTALDYSQIAATYARCGGLDLAATTTGGFR